MRDLGAPQRADDGAFAVELGCQIWLRAVVVQHAARRQHALFDAAMPFLKSPRRGQVGGQPAPLVVRYGTLGTQ